MPFNANTVLNGLFCKKGKTTINFVGTGVLDGPSKQKLFEKKQAKTFNVDASLCEQST